MTTQVGDVKFTGVQDKALQLLGTGLSNTVVAAAIGVTESEITRFLSDDTFKEAVSSLRVKSLQAHNERDASYDRVEDALIQKLENSLDMIYKPRELLSAIAVINKAQRRGISTPEQITTSKEVVPLSLPPVLINKFTVNIQNQVVQAGSQDLVTIQSDALAKLAGVSLATKVPGLPEKEPTKTIDKNLFTGDINDVTRIAGSISNGEILPSSIPAGSKTQRNRGGLSYANIQKGIDDKVAALRQQITG